MIKPVKMHGAPLLDENFNPVRMTRNQTERLAKNKAREVERMGSAWRGAIGSVYESETHYCVNVGWKTKKLS